MALDPTLARIPGLAGYLAMDQYNRGAEGDTLKNAGTLSKLEDHFRENEFRKSITPGMGNDEILQRAIRAVGPEKAATLLQGQANLRETGENRKQIALAQLSARMMQDKAKLDAAERGETRKDRLAQIAEARLRMESHYRGQSAQIASGKLYDETGQSGVGGGTFDIGGLLTPPAATAAPALPPQTLPAGVPPSDAAAFASAQRGVPATVDRVMPESEIAAMGPQPSFASRPSAPVDAEIVQPPAAPNNLDARDLGAGARGPVMGATPAAAPVAPGAAKATPPVFVGSPREQRTAMNKWLLDQNKTSISGGGNLSPQALQFTAQQYLTGDRQAAAGYARSTTARVALQNAIVDEAIKQGMSPQEVASKIAEYAGITAGSRTVGMRAANISLAANEAKQMINIVKETSDKFGRTNFVPWNMAIKAYESGTGEPEIAAFGASINALVNVYARAINPTGVPTVSDKEHARAVLNSVQSPAQVDAVLGIIGRELDIARKAPSEVREGLRGLITGDTAKATGNAPPAAITFLKSNPTVPMKEAFKRKYGYLPDGI